MTPTIKERNPIMAAKLAVPPCVIIDSYGHDQNAMNRNYRLANEALAQLDNLLQRSDLDRLVADYLEDIPEQYREESACPELTLSSILWERDLCRQFMAEVAERLEHYVPIRCPVCYQAAAMPFQIHYEDLGYDDQSADAHLRLAHDQHDLIEGLLSRPDLDDLLAAHARDCAADLPAEAKTPARLRAELEGNRDLCRDFIHKALAQQFKRRHGPNFGRPL